MRSGEAFRVALDALRANRLRSALTMLGVVIGVAAVVVLVALGSGAKQEVEQQVEGLGSNIIIVVPGKFEFGSAPTVSRLTLEDVELLGRVVGDVRPGRRVGRLRRDRRGRAAARRSSRSTASTRTCPTCSTGRWPAGSTSPRPTSTPGDGSPCSAPPCVRRVFGDVDPLGRQVSIAGVRFRVIGVFEKVGLDVRRRPRHRGAHPGDRGAAAVRRRPDRRAGREGADAPTTSRPLQRRLVAALQDKYDGEEFSAVTQTQILGTIGRILGLLTLVLAAIAAHLAARRRRRRLEHHAGQRPGADPRDRAAQGAGRPAARHPAAVPHRGGAALRRRRPDRHRARRRRRPCSSPRCRRCRRSSPGGRRCSRSGCPRRSASSSGSPRRGGPAGSTRSWRCAPSEFAGSAAGRDAG